MKRMIVSFLTICMLASLAVFTGITAYAEVNLTEVTNLAWKEGSSATATWGAVDGANYYLVKVYTFSQNGEELGANETGTATTEIDLQQEIHRADSSDSPVYVQFSVCAVSIDIEGTTYGAYSQLSSVLMYRFPFITKFDTPQNARLSTSFDATWDSIDFIDSSNWYYIDVRCTYNGKSYIDLTTSFTNRTNILNKIRTICNKYSLNGKTIEVSFRVKGYADTISGTGVAITGEFSEWSNSINYNSLDPIILATPQNPKLTETFAATWDSIDFVDSSNWYYIDVRCMYNGQSYIDLTTSFTNKINILDKIRTICNKYSLNGKTIEVSFRVKGYSDTISGTGVAKTGEFSEWSNSIPCLAPDPIILATPQNPKLTETFDATWDSIDLVDSSNWYYIDIRCTYNGKSYIDLTTSFSNTTNILSEIRTICNKYSLNGKTIEVSFRVRGYSSTLTGTGVAKTGEFSEWSNPVPYPARIAVSDLTLSPSEPILYVGNSLYLGKTITPENAYYTTIDWSTSDNTIVPVSTIGRITGLQVGTTTVTAAIGSATDSVLVTVYDISSSIEDPDEQDQVTDIAGDIIDSIVDDENPEIGNTDIDEGDLPEIKEDILEGIWRGDQFFTDVVWYEETFGKYKDNWGQIRRAADDLNAQFAGAYNVEVEMYHKDDAGTDYHIGNITELPDEVTFTFDLPTGMKEVQSGYTRKYVLVRIHKNTIEPVEVTVNDDGTATAKSDSFSDFVLVYVDTKAEPVDLTGYKTLVLPTSMRCIDEEAFTGISAEVVVIPKSCTSIGYRAFADCKSLKYVVIAPDAHVTIDDAAFAGTNAKILYQ